MIPLFKVAMADTVTVNTVTTLKSGYITEGPKVKEFESMLKELFNHNYLATVNSATSGLTLALRLLKDELKWDSDKDVVLTTPFTCFATTVPILTHGMKLKWVDVDPSTAMMSLSDLKSKLSPNTKIIMLVHWGGMSYPLEQLEKLLDDFEETNGFRPWVIEDAAHAFRSKDASGHPIGYCRPNHMVVFSFQAIKLLTTVDGGCLCVPTESLQKKAILLRWFGIDREKRSGQGFRIEPDIADYGYKFHMNDVNATIGISNLPMTESLVKKNADNVRILRECVEELYSLNNLVVRGEPSWWLFTITTPFKKEFINFMSDNNVQVSQVHKRNDLHSCVSEFQEDLPGVDEVERSLCCIPCGWWLSTNELNIIVNNLKDFDDIKRPRSSYLSKNLNYLDLMKSVLYTYQPSLIVEFGILDGCSTRILADSVYHGRLLAYDIFEDFDGNHASESEILEKFKHDEHVSIDKKSIFSDMSELKDNSVDIIHVDVANDGAIYDYVLKTFWCKLKVGGVLMMEGGSPERDAVSWMDKYQKPSISDFLKTKCNKAYKVIGTYPSITLFRKSY